MTQQQTRDAFLIQLQTWWDRVLTAGEVQPFEGWPSEISRRALRESFEDVTPGPRQSQRALETRMGRFMTKAIGPTNVIHRNSGGSRARMVQLPPIDVCRAQFAAFKKRRGQ